jgi:hypothetical protein
MTKKSQIRKDGNSDQVRAFRKAAHEIECDESEERFKSALEAVANSKHTPEPSDPRRR